jgi:hypothetical protein
MIGQLMRLPTCAESDHVIGIAVGEGHAGTDQRGEQLPLVLVEVGDEGAQLVEEAVGRFGMFGHAGFLAGRFSCHFLFQTTPERGVTQRFAE